MNTLEISKNKLQEIRKAEEYFNALATNIQLSGVDLKVIAISSVQENEGKSTTSTNLAVAFARAGYKTLLVDCDIRNSVMTGIFRSRDKIQGLTDFLSGRSQLDQILYATDFPNLDIIESGQVAPNPTGLLQSKNFTVMMDALEAGAEDMQASDDVFEIYTDPDAFNDVVAALEGKGYTFLEADVQMVPQNYVKLTDEEDIKNMEKLIDALEDNDDVQNVYHNWEQD